MTISARTLVSLAGGEDDHTVVSLRGEHDASTVDKLSEVMVRAIALDDADLVVDLSGVQYMGAATVRAIARAASACEGDRGLWCCDPSRRVPAESSSSAASDTSSIPIRPSSGGCPEPSAAHRIAVLRTRINRRAEPARRRGAERSLVMYIGLGTILVIIVIVLLVRR